MSRSEIADVVRSGQLTQNEYRKYVTTYQEKLARPFACFVFILIAIPLGTAFDPNERQHEPGVRPVAPRSSSSTTS